MSFIGEPEGAVAEILERLKRNEAARQRAVIRASAAAAVAVLHLIFIILLLKAEWLFTPTEIIDNKETPLLWLMLPRTNAIKAANEHKTGEKVYPIFKAVSLPPPVTDVDRPNAITLDPALLLGRALACGANSYEYLSREARMLCKHPPWQYKYDRYGDLVLDTRAREPEEEKQRPSDAMAHERNTAPVCLDPNVPCAYREIWGNKPQ